MSNFWTRTVSAVVYVLLFLGCIYSGKLLGSDTWGAVIFAAFLLFVGCGCTFEFYRMVAMQGASPSRWIGYAVTVVCSISVLAPIGVKTLSTAIFELLLTGAFTGVLVAFQLSVVLQLWKHSEQPFRDAAYSVLPGLYIGIPLACMAFIQHEEANLLVMLLIIVWMNDNGAYMGGSLFGRHKMWPRHSPGKTWEGTAIGVVITAVVALFVGPLMTTRVSAVSWVLIAVVCCVCATLGDLAESMLKRSVGVKDSGKIMPGHGGFLDRFDSLLVTTPVYFLCLLFTHSL